MKTNVPLSLAKGRLRMPALPPGMGPRTPSWQGLGATPMDVTGRGLEAPPEACFKPRLQGHGEQECGKLTAKLPSQHMAGREGPHPAGTSPFQHGCLASWSQEVCTGCPPESTAEVLARAGLRGPLPAALEFSSFSQSPGKASGTQVRRPKLRARLLKTSPSSPRPQPYLWHHPDPVSPRARFPPPPQGTSSSEPVETSCQRRLGSLPKSNAGCSGL